MDMNALEKSVASLYAGGWRTTDKKELMEEHDFTNEEAEDICEVLRQYEEEKAIDELCKEGKTLEQNLQEAKTNLIASVVVYIATMDAIVAELKSKEEV